MLPLSFAVLRSARDDTLAVDEEDMTVGYMELDSQGAAQHEERSEMNLVMLTSIGVGNRVCARQTASNEANPFEHSAVPELRQHACLETTTAELTFSTSFVFFNQEHTLRLPESCCSLVALFRLLHAFPADSPPPSKCLLLGQNTVSDS